jgi:hypothetical protein
MEIFACVLAFTHFSDECTSWLSTLFFIMCLSTNITWKKDIPKLIHLEGSLVFFFLFLQSRLAESYWQWKLCFSSWSTWWNCQTWGIEVKVHYVLWILCSTSYTWTFNVNRLSPLQYLLRLLLIKMWNMPFGWVKKCNTGYMVSSSIQSK